MEREVIFREAIGECLIQMSTSGELIFRLNKNTIVFYNFEAVQTLRAVLDNMLKKTEREITENNS